MLSAAAIDYLDQHTEDGDEVHAWYEKSYREAYLRYHKFVAGFYACNEEPDSKFWGSRKIEGAKDQRFEGKEWFTALSGQNVEAGAAGVDELEQGASTLAYLWQHGTQEISDNYDESELTKRRVLWANQLLKQFHSLEAIHWTSKEVKLVPSFKVGQMSSSSNAYFIGDENGAR